MTKLWLGAWKQCEYGFSELEYVEVVTSRGSFLGQCDVGSRLQEKKAGVATLAHQSCVVCSPRTISEILRLVFTLVQSPALPVEGKL